MLVAARRPRAFRRVLGGTVTLNGGDGQTAEVASALGSPLSVLVRDSAGAPWAGVTVTWATSGDGQITPSSVTNGSGIATASWTLGSFAGAQGATAAVAGVGAVPFVATGTAAAASTLGAASTTDQTGAASTPVSSPPSVRVRDQYGNAKAGVTVTFTVTGGGGTRSPATVVSDAAGLATLDSWTLGGSVGPNTLEASVAGLTNSPIIFHANATAAAPASLATVAGTGQTGVVAGTAAAQLGVRVRDAGNAGIPGVTVTWEVVGGGGSLSAPTSVTDSNGDAFITLTTGQTVGLNQVRASVNGGNLNTGLDAWNLTTVPGTKTKLVLVAQPASSGTSGQPLPGQPIVRIADQYGNQTADTDVITATVATGNATIAGGGTMAAVAGLATFTALALTDVDGGSNTVQFSSGALTPVTSAGVTLAPPTPVAVDLQGTVGSATAGVAISPFQVWVVDAGGARVPGATNVITVALTTPGGATLSGVTSVAAVDGIATFSGLSIDLAGTYSFTITEPSLAGDVSNTFPVSAATDLTGWPNEPPGFAQVALRTFASATDNGWSTPTGGVRVTDQADAPMSPPDAWRFSKTGGAGSMGTTEVNIASLNKTELFLGFWFKLHDQFQGHNSQTNKLAVWPLVGGNPKIFLNAFGVDQGVLRAELYLQGCVPNLGGNDASGSRRVRQGGGFGPVTVVRGLWHRLQLRIGLNTNNVADGSAEMWLASPQQPNTQVFAVTNLAIRGTGGAGATDRFTHIRDNPIWGGTGDTVTEVVQIWHDHIYVSAP